jgi:ribosome-associated protein
MIQVTKDLALDERDFQEHFVRASGPGGQNVNKVATAVELRLDIPASTLPEEIKERLRRLGGRRVTTEGVLVIDSRVHRSQAQNRAAARTRLVSLLRQAARRPRARKATKPTRTARERRLQTKKRQGALKASRGRSRKDE